MSDAATGRGGNDPRLLAHDLANELQIVGALASAALEDLPADSSVRSTLERLVAVAADAGDKARRLVCTDESAAVGDTSVEVTEALESAAGLMRAAFGDQLRIELQCAPGLPRVHADPQVLGQVLLELCLNARDAMPSGGTLGLRANAVGPPAEVAVEIVVSDEGHGIDPADLGRVLEPFYTTKAGASGLGLAGVRERITRLGGTVSLESRPGRGTEVRLRLRALGISGAGGPRGGTPPESSGSSA